MKKLFTQLVIAAMFSLQASFAAMAVEGDPITTDTTQTTEVVEPAPPPPAPSPEPLPPAPAPEPAPAPPPSTLTTTTTEAGPDDTIGPIPRWAYDEALQQWVPTHQDTFSYHPETYSWESPLYNHNLRTGWYYVKQAASGPQPVTALQVPAGTVSPAGTTPNTATTPTSVSDQLARLLGLGASNSQTGPGSTNNALATSSLAGLLGNTSRVGVTNNLTSWAESGDTYVTENVFGGNALSGDATVLVNLLNLLNSAWQLANGGLSYFVNNLFGNQTGDILLKPTQTVTGGGSQFGNYVPLGSSNSATGADSTNMATTSSRGDFTLVNRPTGEITNNLELLATSGDATVGRNVEAGDATSGDATVGINILNLISSAISSGQSFFGLLNIFGNLNGDILFPDGFLDSLFSGASTLGGGGAASNTQTGADSTNTATVDMSSDLSIINNPTAVFNNNLQTEAISGDATVSRNVEGGNATTGDASTSTNLFNLFNTSLFGENAVLVLVNVMGTWVGHIMQLPGTGSSTSALLTGGPTTVSNSQTGADSTNTASSTQTNNFDITNQPAGTITNNIRAGAISGNADVTENVFGGNATSGDAAVATNVANIFNSTLNLQKWFGVLVINVFGDWYGSVNDDTAAGEVAEGSTASSGNGAGGGSLPRRFVGVVAAIIPVGTAKDSVATEEASSEEPPVSAAISSTPSNSSKSPGRSSSKSQPMLTAGKNRTNGDATNLILFAAIAMMASAGMLTLERKLRK